jgi:hypothetical protein
MTCTSRISAASNQRSWNACSSAPSTSEGRAAVEYFGAFHPSVNGDHFNNFLRYMTVQKLRTPKGLGWLAQEARTRGDDTLKLMVRLQQVYAALWTGAFGRSPTRQTQRRSSSCLPPVTVYNRSCAPSSSQCRGFNDPHVALHATHTIFPLSLDRVLLLTNLSWIRNPYQNERGVRPNPNPWRTAMFNFTAIQTRRQLSELEVRQINFIVKSRALRRIAAAQEDWLYPEQHVSKADWYTFGDGYLLMPDPRAVHLGGKIMIGHRNGDVSHFDAHGRRPADKDYEREESAERPGLYRFEGEFARLHGPVRRGRALEFGHDIQQDSDDLHEVHLSYEKRRGKRNGPPAV